MLSLGFTLMMFLFCFIGSSTSSVYIVLMEGESVTTKSFSGISEDDILMHKEELTKSHDVFLESLFEAGSYTKLYSYTHLLNGFAVYAKGDEVLDMLQGAERVLSTHKDVKLEKCTTHTPDFLGLTDGAWPALGGPDNAGEGIVIGLIDTGINPSHPSFITDTATTIASTSTSPSPILTRNNTKFKGKCIPGDRFPASACNGKVVGAQYYARAARAAGDFDDVRDYASPFDADGHGSHTASIAAGNHHVPVIANNFTYGYASGMAPGARIAVYKAVYSFGGYMTDVVAAIEQAVEDGVDILSLSIGPANVPSGSNGLLSILELQLLLATRAGVLAVQAVGNKGPSSASIISFSPWINSVAASITDRIYNSSICLGNGRCLTGIGLAPPTLGGLYLPVAAAADVCQSNFTAGVVKSCQSTDPFIKTLSRGKLIICMYTFLFESETGASLSAIAETMDKIGAAGFILTMDPDIGSDHVKGATVTFQVPGVFLNHMESSSALWEYYNSNTVRNRKGRALRFHAAAKILDSRQATYTAEAPVVASYSSRGPIMNGTRMHTEDVLKPNVLAPGSSIWAAWTPDSQGDFNSRGQNFAMLSGTSMATPHVAGIAALIKQKHPDWSPSSITSAMMTTTNVYDNIGARILAAGWERNNLEPSTPFDFGAGSINPSKAVDPGLVFDANFQSYVQFLCAVPGVDEMSIRRMTGIECSNRKKWCSDLNTPSVTVSNLAGSRRVIRRVTNVGNADEKYNVLVRQPDGVRIKVAPEFFGIRMNSSRYIELVLEPTRVTNAYTFGEMVLQGNQNHLVRVPISVYVSRL